MSEKEIRSIVKRVCDELDLRRRAGSAVRQGVRKVVLPTMLGASLAMAGCDSRDVPVNDGAVPADTRSDGPGPAPLYAAPGPDGGVQPPYMAPDAGPGPEYMAPDAGVDMEPASDVGPAPLYAAPADMGVLPPYMAPDGGVEALYAAPGTDWGVQPDYMAPGPDGGIAPLYAVVGPDGSA